MDFFQLRKRYNLNYIIEPRAHNGQVFYMIKPLMVSAMEGYNICVMAYGASGKTVTTAYLIHRHFFFIKTNCFPLCRERKIAHNDRKWRRYWHDSQKCAVFT